MRNAQPSEIGTIRRAAVAGMIHQTSRDRRTDRDGSSLTEGPDRGVGVGMACKGMPQDTLVSAPCTLRSKNGTAFESAEPI